MNKKTFKIAGMHCASCAGTIERVLLKTAGVRSASVSFASESALVEFDGNIASATDLAHAVESVGYKFNIDSQVQKGEVADYKNTKTVLIKVIGMDSSHCAMVVGNALKKLSGIKNTDIDFSNQRAKVVFDSKKLTSFDIFKVITDVGYKPIEEWGKAEEVLDKEKIEREKRLKILKRRLISGSVLSVFIFF